MEYKSSLLCSRYPCQWPHEPSPYLSLTLWQQKLAEVIAKNIQSNGRHLTCGSFALYPGHLIWCQSIKIDSIIILPHMLHFQGDIFALS
jgi:hypothetical protein